jgi:hypothetical protein
MVGADGNLKVPALVPGPFFVNTLEVGSPPDPLLFEEGIKAIFQGIRFHRKIAFQYSFASTISLFLPFARLRFKTNCPPLVDIRFRKPWVLFRRVLLG